MQEFRFFTFSLPGTDERFSEKLGSLSDSINRQKVSNPSWVTALGRSSVQQIAIASSHVAILLEDGRICRIGYSLNAENLESSKTDEDSAWSIKKPKKKSARMVRGVLGGERPPYRRSVTTTLGSSAPIGSSAAPGSGASGRGGRSYRNLFMSTTVPFIPPSQVPEDLIVQVQNVLQGKSRSLIIRELQRTNLDVNSAVNNLLSRDDEDGEDDEVGDLFADDLMSFVENNLTERANGFILESDQMLVEDYLNYATSYRGSGSTGPPNFGGRRMRNELVHPTGRTSTTAAPPSATSTPPTTTTSVEGMTDSNTTTTAANNSRGDDFGRRWLESRLRDPFTAHMTSTTVSSTLSSTGATTAASAAPNSGTRGAGSESSSIFADSASHPWEIATSGANANSTKNNKSSHVIWEEPEWFILLPDAMSSPQPRFIQIAAMHSELVALSKQGQVYQWKWNVSMPFVHPDIANVHHPRIAHLDLQNETITSLSASSLRCSVLTESGKVATWMDPAIASYCSKLEHGAIAINEYITQQQDSSSTVAAATTAAPSGATGEIIKELKVCDLFTVASTTNGKLFWWGVAPFSQRRKLLEKQATSKSGSVYDSSGRDQNQLAITEGCMVAKKKSPMYHAGAIGFCDATYPPKVGQLMEDIWNLDASCRFKVLPMEKKKRDDCKKTEMLPPPSPVSVGSEGSHKSTSRKRRRSVSPHPFAPQPLEEEIEELWNPRNVVFLEDSQNIPIGTVLKVDGNIAAVRFPPSEKRDQNVITVSTSNNSDNSNHSISGDDISNIWKDCRFLHKSDLQALKPNSLSKFMDCIQKTPKNLFSNAPIPEKFNIMTFAVDSKGVHIIFSGSYKFHYVLIEPGGGGGMFDHRTFFTDLPAFIGLKNPISLQIAPEEPGRLLIDGNGCLYPLCKDDAVQMREPTVLNMLPIKTAAMGVHHLREGSFPVHKVLLTAFITKPSSIMSAILHCNQTQLDASLYVYELNPEKEGPLIVNERCDGNRNIIHALVSIGRPTSNNNSSNNSASNARTKSKEETTANRNAVPNSSSSGVNQTTTTDHHPITSITSHNMMPIDTERVLAQFERHNVTGSGVSASLSSSSAVLQNGSEILRRLREERSAAIEGARRLREEARAAVETARRQFSLPTSLDVMPPIPSIAWPPDSPAYESIPLSPGSLLDITSTPSGLPTSRNTTNVTSTDAKTSSASLKTTTTTSATPLLPNSAAKNTPTSQLPNSDEERQRAAFKMLITLLTFRKDNFQKYLIDMLCLQDAKGMTPLMLAVYLRSYNMAVLIFNAAKRLASDKYGNINQNTLMKMVFPPAASSSSGSKSRTSSAASSSSSSLRQQQQQHGLRRDDPDQSPLYMLCFNDNCSFTWTGNLHINQDIFECRTCGLYDTYCCCTECARNCHKGHDCKLKKIWPTAYCDCWRRGRCCALIEGDQKTRFGLLCDLLQHTNLASVPNRKGEHLLFCLVNTISRQMLEQSGLSKSSVPTSCSNGTGTANKSNNTRHLPPVETENLEGMPDSNLDPPKFCRGALCQVVVNWKAVSSLMLQNVESSDERKGGVSNSLHDLSPLQSSYMNSQTGSAKLDAFVYKLIVKCKNETGFVTLEKLCETLLAHLKKPLKNSESLLVARRFVRSVCRVFVVLSMETQNSKNKAISSEPLRKCKTVFRMLMGVAIEELIETANCLLAPVRMGIARPTRPFASLTSATDEKQASADLFSVEPLPPRRNNTSNNEQSGRSRNRNHGRRSETRGGRRPGDTNEEGNFNSRSSSGDRTVGGLNLNNETILEAIDRSHDNGDRAGDSHLINSNSDQNQSATLLTTSADAVDSLRFPDGSAAPFESVNIASVSNNDLSRRGEGGLDDTFNDDHDLDDQDDMEDDGHGSSADGGVGEDDVTFDVDMMEDEESEDGDGDVGGVENEEESEDDDEDDDDDDDDDEHRIIGASIPANATSENGVVTNLIGDIDERRLVRLGTASSSQQQQTNSISNANNSLRQPSSTSNRVDNRLPSPPLSNSVSRNQPNAANNDRDRLFSPEVSRNRNINSTGDIYFSVSEPNGVSRNRDRVAIDSSDAGVLSDGEESSSQSESETEDDNIRDHEMVNDPFLTESLLDAGLDALPQSSSTSHNINRNVPVGIQWAVGGQPVVIPAPPSRGMIYVDQATIRRGGVANAAAAVAAANNSLNATVNMGAGVPGGVALTASAAAELTCSSSATNVSLARAFGLVIRSVTELIFLAAEEETDGGYMTQQQFDALQDYVEKRLHATWRWLCSVLDSTEAQLRFGAALIASTDTSHPNHPLHPNQRNSNQSSTSNSLSAVDSNPPISRRTFESGGGGGGVSRASRSNQQDSSAARKDFLNYVLSLMRSHSNEHADSLPVIDISAFKHIAYVLDSMVYYLKNGKEAILKCEVDLVGPTWPEVNNTATPNDEFDDYENEDDSLDEAIFVGLTTGSSSIDDFTPNDGMSSRKGFSFFRRSPSTLCLGASQPNIFDAPLKEALPLADRPHILTPHATKEEMFGQARFTEAPAVSGQEERKLNETITISRNEIEIVPLQMGLDERIESTWEDLVGADDTGLDENNEVPVAQSSNQPMDTDYGERSPVLMFGLNPPLASDASIGLSGISEDELETGALDMSSSTLNAAEAAEQKVQGDGDTDTACASASTALPRSSSDGTAVKFFSNESNVLEISGSSTPKRLVDNQSPVENEQKTIENVVNTSAQSQETVMSTEPAELPSTSKKVPRVPNIVETSFSRNMLLGRWTHSLELFGRVFIEDVGAQPGSLLAEISSFDVREARFKKEMERIRNSQTRDLALEVERDRNQLILQTMKQLNLQYSKRSSFPGQPLAVHKVKVTFKNEPGEGSGVSRSFYTSIAQVLLADERLPKLDSLFSSLSSSYTQMSRIRKVRTSTLNSTSQPTQHHQSTTQPLNSTFRWNSATVLNPSVTEAVVAAAITTAATSSAPTSTNRSVSSPAVTSAAAIATNNTTTGTGTNVPSSAKTEVTMDVTAPPWTPEPTDVDSLGAELYFAVLSLHPEHASKITGMLLEVDQLFEIKDNPDRFAEVVEEALGLILSCSAPPPTSAPSNTSSANAAMVLGDIATPDDDECAPLFYQPGKTGFYSPRVGKCTKERLDVFRNVGRLIGICLLQNELIPLTFNRHVLKYILHKEFSWHDFAFFDPVMYESMRKLVLDSMHPDAEEMFKELGLSYSVVLSKQEGGGEVDLVPLGSQYDVTPKNVLDFVRRYCEHRMRITMEKPLRMIRRGVYEVVPPSALSGLTAEDLRLLLNGTSTVDPKQLASFTNFIDETGGDNPERIKKFKRSFWNILERMSQKELQDLMYFWTGSPSVPASEEGFQPMPSITLRPADDLYFPSANTCISRLYIPLYSSKAHLRTKLLQAIQVKSFGFV